MYTLIIVLLIIVAILICGIVLIQESKGGGLASGFSAANATLGVRKTTDFLEKTTWTLAAVLIVLCVLSSKFASDSKKETNINMAAPAAPAPAQQNPLNVGGEVAPAAGGEKAAPAAPAQESATPAAPAKESAPAAPAQESAPAEAPAAPAETPAAAPAEAPAAAPAK